MDNVRGCGSQWRWGVFEGSTVAHLHHEWVNDIVHDQTKVRMSDPVLNILLPPCEEVVEHGDLMPLLQDTHHRMCERVGEQMP